jgi:hypothetical protein
MRTKRPPKRPKLRPFKPACLRALRDIDAVRREAQRRGLALYVTVPVAGRTRPTLHWRFVALASGQGEVLHYWPASGRFWVPGTGAKGIVADVWVALETATAYLWKNATLWKGVQQ